MGKSRLALALAEAQRAQFPDGVYFVSLSPITAPELVVSAMAEALRFTFYGGDDVKILRESDILAVVARERAKARA